LRQYPGFGMNSIFSQNDLDWRGFGARSAPKPRILLHFDLIIQVHVHAHNIFDNHCYKKFFAPKLTQVKSSSECSNARARTQKNVYFTSILENNDIFSNSEVPKVGDPAMVFRTLRFTGKRVNLPYCKGIL